MAEHCQVCGKQEDLYCVDGSPLMCASCLECVKRIMDQNIPGLKYDDAVAQLRAKREVG